MLGLCFGEALANALHLAFALQLAFADRQGGEKTDDYAAPYFLFFLARRGLGTSHDVGVAGRGCRRLMTIPPGH
jgi:hypothetical protein